MEITFNLSQTSSLGTELYSGTPAASETKQSSDGDTVSISEEGKAKAAAMTASKLTDSEDTEESSTESTLDALKKMIEQLKKEIEELEEKDIPEEQKEERLAALKNQLMQVQLEYAQALKEKSGSSGTTLLSGLGSSAEGFANSLT